MTLNRTRLKFKAESGDRQAAAIIRIISKPDRLLGVILLGNTLANIAAATLFTFIVTVYAPLEHAETVGFASSIALTTTASILGLKAELSKRGRRKLVGEAIRRVAIGGSCPVRAW